LFRGDLYGSLFFPIYDAGQMLGFPLSCFYQPTVISSPPFFRHRDGAVVLGFSSGPYFAVTGILSSIKPVPSFSRARPDAHVAGGGSAFLLGLLSRTHRFFDVGAFRCSTIFPPFARKSAFFSPAFLSWVIANNLRHPHSYFPSRKPGNCFSVPPPCPAPRARH